MLDIKKFHNKMLGHDVEAVKVTGDLDTIEEIIEWVNHKNGGASLSWDLNNKDAVGLHTRGGWSIVLIGEWVVWSETEGFTGENQSIIDVIFEEIPEEPESNLVAHARRELEAIGEEPDTIVGYLKVIQAFADMGHSGGSASVAIPTINQLLQFKPLGPITNDPDEWYNHGRDMGGHPDGDFWQNKRDGEAFSNDGGKTYYLLSERPLYQKTGPLHTSVEKVKKNA